MDYNKKGPMLIVNKTKGTNLDVAEMADSFFSRFRGLMLKKNIKRGLILKIPAGRGRRGSAIHMFFMRIPLDLIFLDEEKIVVDTVTLKPWQTYTPKSPARYVIEFKKDVLNNSSTEIGDEMDFTCEMA
jgi:uncharacterized membrane protein (UPF0127 family)